MATYVKGANKYSVDIKPFTPDYKFLSAVLETRQDKYDTNFKQTNDLYNKVVYADLSREDTKERRDQYAEQIGPQIEKISGMDLSLAQNVNQAKSVFEPFYEDDLTVKDIVYTSNYRDEMRKANRFRNSSNEEMNSKFSDISVQGLNYRMEDFIGATKEEALDMGVPKYVDRIDLFKVATEVLEEMDPNLSMKMDRFGTDANGDPITDFIITEKNGRLIQGAALQTLQSALLSNPRVQRFYSERSFVQSRDFAAKTVADGTFGTIKQAQQEWANTTISRITALNKQNEIEKSAELTELESANVRWDNWKKNNGVVEGSQIDDAINENLSAAEATRIALDRIKGIQSTSSNKPNTLDGSLNQAYSMLMNYNIMGDLSRAALSYSQRDQEYLIRENKFAIQQKGFYNDMAKIRANATNAFNLEAFKQQGNDRNTMLKEGYQMGPDGKLIRLPWAEGMDMNNPLAALLQGNNTTFGSANTIDVPVDEENKPLTTPNMIERTKQQFLEKDNALAARQSDNIVKMLQILYPTGTDATGDEMGTGIYNIKVPNKTEGVDELTVDIDGLRQLLGEQVIEGEGENAVVTGYKNRDLINNLYNIVSEKFTDTRAVTIANANTTLNKDQRNQYDALYNEIAGLNGTNTQIAALSQFINSAYDNYAQTYNTVKGNAFKGGSNDALNTKLLYEAGFPDIIGEDNIPLNKDEYINTVVEMVKRGEIINPDLWGWDSGTENEDYMVPKLEVIPGSGGGGGVSPTTGISGSSSPRFRQVYDDNGAPVMVPDDRAIGNEAALIYDNLSLQLNQALTGQSGDFISGDLDSEIYGISGKFSDVVSNPSYVRNFNPVVPNPLAEQEVFQMLMQIDELDNKGKPYGIIAGDIDAIEDPTQLANVKQPLAVKVFNMWKSDAAVWMSGKTPAVSTGIKAPSAQIIYMPVMGRAEDGSKILAGYQIVFDADWLASKKAGSNTQSGNLEFGPLTTEDILMIQGRKSEDDEMTGQAGITIMFPQSIDVNPKAEKNTYYSFVQTDISKNGGFADYTIPNDDGINPTGEFRIIQVGPGDYNVYSKEFTYQPGGTYTVKENTVKVDMSQGLPGLDKQVLKYKEELETKREENRLAREADQATNGTK